MTDIVQPKTPLVPPVLAKPLVPQAPSWQTKIAFLDDPNASSKSRVLAYGAAGSGKTHFLGTWPGVFILDYDAGGKTLRKLHARYLPLYESRGVVKTTLDVIDAALARRPPFDDGSIETIGFDSLSALSSAALTDFMYQAKRDPLEVKASFDEWGRLSEFFKELGKRFRRLSTMYNVVVTALVQVEKDENTGICFGKPMLEGKARDKVGALFDEVYYTVDESVKDARKYALYTSRYQFYEAKTRLGLPYRVESPSYAKLVEAASK